MMDSHHIGYNKPLIQIESEDFTITISGKIGNKKVDAIKANFNVPAFFNCSSDYYDSINVKVICSDGILANTSGNTMMPVFFEDSKYEILLSKRKDCNLNIYHEREDIRNSIINVGDNLFGSFIFDEEIGETTFRIKKDSNIVLTLIVEVFPTKMDYQKDYREIISEVNEEIAAIAFQYMGKTFHKAQLKDTDHQTSVEFINILKKIFCDFEKALIRIENKMKHDVITTEKMKYIHNARVPSRKNLNYIRKNPQILKENSRGIISIDEKRYIPTKVIESNKITTNDIFENRFVKYILQNVVSKLSFIKKRIIKLYGDSNEYFKVVEHFEKNINRHLKRNFMNIGDISGKKSMSLVFSMAPGYKQLFYYYNLLKKGLTLSDDIYNISPKKIWKLYEIWCYIKLHKILAEMGFKVKKYGILKSSDNGLNLTLIQDEEAVMEYSNDMGKNIELFYNKKYSNIPTTNQKPDTVLCIKSKDAKDDERIYIFDAKYRLNVEYDGKIGPREEDINVMHRYRDAIVSELSEESRQFKYDTFGAYVMFPFSNEKEYIEHKFYKSIEKVNIGAFPMLPGSTTLIRNHIAEILDQSLIEAKDNLVIRDEYDFYYKFKNENVMVVTVPDKKHYGVYLENGFYHIPLKRLSNVRLGVEYITFYKPIKAFGKEAGIYEYAKIDRIYRYKRRECKELPSSNLSITSQGSSYKKTDEEYIRIEFGKTIELGPILPIQYGNQLISYTTLYLLKNAENFHELKFKSLAEIRLYKRLKKLSREQGLKLERTRDSYIIGGEVIELLSNNKVRVNGVIDEGFLYDKVSH